MEHFYERALKTELEKNGLKVESEVYLPIDLDGTIVEDSYRIDLLVENEIVVEIKSIDKLLPVHHRQVRTYMKLSNNRLGYLINFNNELIMDGVNRIIMSPYKPS
jgi:GxxExxY protein